MPRAVVHCRTTEDVQLAIRMARDYGLPLSVRGGGHHWAGRALSVGIVIDLSGMTGCPSSLPITVAQYFPEACALPTWLQ